MDGSGCPEERKISLERYGPEEEEAHPDGPSTGLAPDSWAFRYDFRTFLL